MFEKVLRLLLEEEGNVDAILAKRDSLHSGDCTKDPWTCTRCLYENYARRAKAICALFEEDGR